MPLLVKPDVVTRKLGRSQGWLADAESILRQPRETFLADAKERDLATFYLFLAIQEAIDLAIHWVADEEWGTTDDVGGTFDILAERGAIDSSLAERLRGCVGLRNRIAHGYASLDHARVHDEYEAGIVTLRSFLSRVADAAGV